MQMNYLVCQFRVHKEALNAHGVVNTHYTNLKVFADKNAGTVNGAMKFDAEHLEPLYELEIGKPGSSFALEVAQKIGLSKHIVDNAKRKLGSQQIDFEKLTEMFDQGSKKTAAEILKGRVEEKAKELVFAIFSRVNGSMKGEFVSRRCRSPDRPPCRRATRRPASTGPAPDAAADPESGHRCRGSSPAVPWFSLCPAGQRKPATAWAPVSMRRAVFESAAQGLGR